MITPVDYSEDRDDSHAIGIPLTPDAQATLERHRAWMTQAIALAAEAGSRGEIPVGAIVVNDQNEAIATGVNRRETDGPNGSRGNRGVTCRRSRPGIMAARSLYALRHPRTLLDVRRGDRHGAAGFAGLRSR
jgi:hypothetical protein